MLTPEQINKLQNNYLETMIRRKMLYLDQETWDEIRDWKIALQNEVNENNQLNNHRDKLIKQLKDLNEDKKEVARKGQELLDKNKSKVRKLENIINFSKSQIQELNTDLDTVYEILEQKNQAITSLLAKKKKKTTDLVSEIKKQSQANHRKKKQLKRDGILIKLLQQEIVNKDSLITNKDKIISQLQGENDQQKTIIAKKTGFINRQQQKIINLKKNKGDLQLEIQGLKQDKQVLQIEITNLKTQHQNEISKKEQKIAELEKEIAILKNNLPPLVPVNNKQETEKPVAINQPVNGFTSKKEDLLIIEQQKKTIQQLQSQLKNISNHEEKVIITDWKTVERLQEKLRDKETKLAQLHFYQLLSLGIGACFLFSAMKLLALKKRRKKLMKQVS